MTTSSYPARSDASEVRINSKATAMHRKSLQLGAYSRRLSSKKIDMKYSPLRFAGPVMSWSTRHSVAGHLQTIRPTKAALAVIASSSS
jgi:hypothetical protein